MPAQPTISPADIAALRKRFTKGGEGAERAAQWMAARQGRMRTARALMDYHDLLLFIQAFPANEADHTRAGEELARLAGLVQQQANIRGAMRDALTDSGMAGAPSCANFSIDLTRWLFDVAGASVQLDSFTGDEDLMRALLVSSALHAEADAMDHSGYTIHERVRDACGGDDAAALQWIVRAVDGLAATPALRTALWQVLNPLLLIDAPPPFLTRTFCRGLATPLHPYMPAGAVDAVRIIRSPLPPPRRLKADERMALVNAVRGALLGHLRETDTTTLCDPAAVEWQDLGDGLGMALLPLPLGRRTAFDTYVGSVLFSNTVPVAYGGAWIFPGRSKVGINVFPAFRGGPSMLLFARIMQCYAQRYGVECFEAESYQLGHGNADGIRSGAYWFYYRAGFRSEDPKLFALAEAERAILAADRHHRTPASTLRKLVAGSMRLHLTPGAAPDFEPGALSEAVLQHLSTVARGDRAAAVRQCAARVRNVLGVADDAAWPADERRAFIDLAPAIDLIPDLAKWTAQEKRSLLALMRAKGQRTEDQYIGALRAHKRLMAAWAQAAA
jgi:hypothetical protein